jgi:hypothetical protein
MSLILIFLLDSGQLGKDEKTIVEQMITKR